MRRYGRSFAMPRTGPPLRALLATRQRATASSKAKKSAHRTGSEIKRQTRAVAPSKPKPSRRPLLVIDGDSFAHRSYYALPKTIRRSDSNAAGAVVGFANLLLRFYADERPRAVIVGCRPCGLAPPALCQRCQGVPTNLGARR